MKIPRYWSGATAEDENRDGRQVSISCWRSSDASQDEAHESALKAAKRALSYLLRGERLDHVRPEIDQIIQVHDQMTRGNEPLPLA